MARDGETGGMGDEFAIVADLALPQLITLAVSIRLNLHRDDDAVPLTASIGVAVASDRADDTEQVISKIVDAADAALYEAKAAGRNRVACVDLTGGDRAPRVCDA